MKRMMMVLTVAAMVSVGVSAPAEAASGPKRHSSSCKALGYKAKVATFSIQRDGLGDKVGEIRLYGKSRSSNRLCMFTQRSKGVKASQFSAGVDVLVKSGRTYSYKTASSVRKSSKRSYSYTFKTLEGKKAVRTKRTMSLDGAILTSDGQWSTGGYTRVG
jgi:hypothetical protein